MASEDKTQLPGGSHNQSTTSGERAYSMSSSESDLTEVSGLKIKSAPARWILAGAALLLFLLAGLWLVSKRPAGTPGGSAMQVQPAEPADLRQHPLYSGYQFATGSNVVRMGTQPCWTYCANVIEAIRRDPILSNELSQLGMRLEVHPFLKGDDINYFMNQGLLDFGIGGYPPTLKMAVTHDVTVAVRVAEGFSEVVARRCLTLHDLKGKRIGSPFGSDAHRMLLEVLEVADLRADQVRLIHMDINEILPAMLDGRIDACAVWPPTSTVVRERVPDTHVLHRSRWLGFSYYRNDFEREYPEATQHVLAAYARAIAWINLDRRHLAKTSAWAVQACKVFSQNSIAVSVSELMETAEGVVRPLKTPVISEDDLEGGGQLAQAFHFLQKTGAIRPDVDWPIIRAKFASAPMLQVLREPARYRLRVYDYPWVDQEGLP